MRALTPFGGGEYYTPLHKEWPKDHWHKSNPGVTPVTCGINGEKAQVMLLWMRASSDVKLLVPTSKENVYLIPTLGRDNWNSIGLEIRLYKQVTHTYEHCLE